MSSKSSGSVRSRSEQSPHGAVWQVVAGSPLGGDVFSRGSAPRTLYEASKWWLSGIRLGMMHQFVEALEFLTAAIIINCRGCILFNLESDDEARFRASGLPRKLSEDVYDVAHIISCIIHAPRGNLDDQKSLLVPIYAEMIQSFVATMLSDFTQVTSHGNEAYKLILRARFDHGEPEIWGPLRCAVEAWIFNAELVRVKTAPKFQLEDAEKLMHLMLQPERKNVDVWILIGQCTEMTQQWGLASIAYAQAASLVPDDDWRKAEALYGYAFAHACGATYPLPPPVPHPPPSSFLASPFKFPLNLPPSSSVDKTILNSRIQLSSLTSYSRLVLLVQQSKESEKKQKPWFGKCKTSDKYRLESLVPVFSQMVKQSGSDLVPSQVFGKGQFADEPKAQGVPNAFPHLMKILPSVCAHCSNGGIALLACSRCRAVRYCNAECQRQDWRAHKPHCTPHAKNK